MRGTMRKQHFLAVIITLASGALLACHGQTLMPELSAELNHDVTKHREPQQRSPEFARRLSLEGNGGSYVVEWSYGDDDITFRVTVRTLGWVGLGFSPRGNMKNADMVIGWVRNGKAYLTDRFATGNEQPKMDDHQDYELVSGTESDSSTVLIFRRQRNTSDCQDVILTAATTRLVWSYHRDDPCNQDGPLYHGPVHRGTRSVLLFASDPSEMPNLPLDVQKDEFLNDNVRPVRNAKTFYWCTIFRFPEVDRPHHVIRYEPVLTPGNEPFIHHIILYACYASPPDETLYSFSNICFKLPKGIQNCMSVVFTWAIGGGPFDFPAHVGYSFGGSRDPLFLRMEVHYDNPRLPDDFHDSSGLRFYYISSLRQHNAGILVSGVFPSWWFVIPPKQDEFQSYGWCLDNCTKMYFPPEGMKIFAAMPHTHIAGQRLRFRQFRNGKLVDDIINEQNFDCDFQEVQLFQKESTIMPGDVLQTECTYKTTDRENITYGGFGRRDEMCLALLLYYPKIDNFGDCLSTYQPAEVLKRLCYENASALPVEMDQETTVKAYQTFNWTDPVFIAKFKRAVKEANLYFRCDNETRLEQMDPFAAWKIPKVEYPKDDSSGHC